MHACERCYSRKTKCDRRVPQCSSCLKSRSTCQYSNKRRNRQLPAEYLESLEARLNDLEQENQRLRDQRNITSPSPSATDGINGSELEITDTSLQLNVSNTRSNATDTNDAPANTSPTQSSGSLQRTPCEESRYLGSSNGVEFIDVVERAVDFPNAGGLFGRVTAYRATPTRIAVPSSLQSVTLVDASVAMPLIKSYFEHWHLTFPLLYRPSFMQMVEQMYSDTTLYRRDAACAFAFDIVLALGSIPSKRVAQYVGDAESHFVRALARLDGLSEFRDIRLLQAFLLYCKYGIHASLRDTSSEMWELLGKATQLCVELGLHNSSSAFSPKCDMHITGPLPSSIQVEMLRRCFWCYYNLERYNHPTFSKSIQALTVGAEL
ncbi:fungal-specific transcription factor domain-containing protein [Penicillium angulare]|uniref:Fungal-specific transcription factor domain-containing protein n=1 Tax=Penicillium angulare TaxID=116970 RepID=A0A9W9EFB1_9EURO|nr:fungal-specific transcription factor domain-containing protein [Penicillium angulare]